MCRTIKSYRVIDDADFNRLEYKFRDSRGQSREKTRHAEKQRLHVVEFTEDTYDEFNALYQHLWKWKCASFYLNDKLVHSWKAWEVLRDAYRAQDARRRRGDAEAMRDHPGYITDVIQARLVLKQPRPRK